MEEERKKGLSKVLRRKKEQPFLGFCLLEVWLRLPKSWGAVVTSEAHVWVLAAYCSQQPPFLAPSMGAMGQATALGMVWVWVVWVWEEACWSRTKACLVLLGCLYSTLCSLDVVSVWRWSSLFSVSKLGTSFSLSCGVVLALQTLVLPTSAGGDRQKVLPLPTVPVGLPAGCWAPWI